MLRAGIKPTFGHYLICLFLMRRIDVQGKLKESMIKEMVL